jgi:hypothetical protein
MDDGDKCVIAIGILVIVVGFMFVGYAVSNSHNVTTETHNLYSCNTPSGYLWTETSGGLFAISSSLQDSYVLKYFDANGEFKTIILDATAQNVHVYNSGSNNTMYFEKIQAGWAEPSYYIYVPLMG